MEIRSLNRKDYDTWLPLWQENCLNQIDATVTKSTWQRLTNPKENVFGLGAFDGTELKGFLHYILHPTTGFIEPACYMQDLFTDKQNRNQGIAKRLIWELNALGKSKNWARIYWFADNDNIAAQKLYKTLGIEMNFSLHMLHTQN